MLTTPDILREPFSMAPSNSGSPKVLSLARQWFKHCRESHESCRDDASTIWYPTRLLEVLPNTSDPRLIVTTKHNLQGGYATLSHCWGSKPIVKLLGANSIQFQEGIDLLSLPLTFQHAIALCRSFGLRYIWIDSLCIVRRSRNSSARGWLLTLSN